MRSPRRLLLRAAYLLPGCSIRLRLTVVYTTLFLASGAALLAVTYVLVRQATAGQAVLFKLGPTEEAVVSPNNVAIKNLRIKGTGGVKLPPKRNETSRQEREQLSRLQAQAKQQREAELKQLTEKSGIALAAMAALSVLLGWLAAGRMLRPLRTLNERVREISAVSLHKRLALDRPDDELKHLADTFDDLLSRLEGSFAAQRQFVANASHELRTPLARARTISEVALTDPDATVESLRESHERVLAAGEQQERLIEALLTLARSERGLDELKPFDLADIAELVLSTRRAIAEDHGLHLQTKLETAPTAGDARLAERLIANLVDNALRYNTPHGEIQIATTTRNGQAVVSVANTGPSVPADELTRLFQPFQRLAANRTGHRDGTGLGLSIIHAIATAHGAALTAEPRPDGGLAIEVGFPRS
jgi:signal transduction histidine kinase